MAGQQGSEGEMNERVWNKDFVMAGFKGAETGDTDAIKCLLDAGWPVDADPKIVKMTGHVYHDFVGTLLGTACSYGREDQVYFLLKMGASLDGRSSDRDILPCAEAFKNGHTKLAMLLLRDADDWDKCLEVACANANSDEIGLLLKHDYASPSKISGGTMGLAILHPRILDGLLKFGADANAFLEFENQRAPLVFMAASLGCSESLLLLLAAGGNPDHQATCDGARMSPLEAAEYKGHRTCAEILRNALRISKT